MDSCCKVCSNSFPFAEELPCKHLVCMLCMRVAIVTHRLCPICKTTASLFTENTTLSVDTYVSENISYLAKKLGVDAKLPIILEMKGDTDSFSIRIDYLSDIEMFRISTPISELPETIIASMSKIPIYSAAKIAVDNGLIYLVQLVHANHAYRSMLYNSLQPYISVYKSIKYSKIARNLYHVVPAYIYISSGCVNPSYITLSSLIIESTENLEITSWATSPESMEIICLAIIPTNVKVSLWEFLREEAYGTQAIHLSERGQLIWSTREHILPELMIVKDSLKIVFNRIIEKFRNFKSKFTKWIEQKESLVYIDLKEKLRRCIKLWELD